MRRPRSDLGHGVVMVDLYHCGVELPGDSQVVVAGREGEETGATDDLVTSALDRVLPGSTALRSPMSSNALVSGFLDDLRAQLKQGTFRPLPVRDAGFRSRTGR